jgi:hypothetical protein
MLNFSAGLARSQPQAAGLVVTHTSQLTSTHSISGFDSLLTAFDLTAADSAGQPVDQYSHPFTMTMALAADTIDALAQTDAATAGSENGGSAPGPGATGGRPLIQLLAWDASSQAWLAVPATLDLASYRIEASVTRFTEYAIVVSYQHLAYIPLISR